MSRVRAVALCALTLLLSASATADAHPGHQHRAKVTQTARNTTVHEHGMTAAQIRQVARTLFAARMRPRAVPMATPGLAAGGWCGTQRSSDDTASALSNAPTVKVIYARAADQPDNFAAYADLMQQTAGAVSQLVFEASGGARQIRWDAGTGCGASYVDIQTVVLPRNLADYGSGQLASRFFADIRSALGISGVAAGDRTYLVFADRLGLVDGGNTPGGQGEILGDSRPAGTNLMNAGNRVAVLYGRGESTFFRNSWGINYTYTSALHEVGHTLGAVQNDAPNTSGGFHCNDGLDVMCYADGGPQSAYVTSRCAQTIFDCGADDYFSAAPAGGSYLASHWNLFDSPFLCQSALCETSSDAPQVTLDASAQGTQVTLTADIANPGPGQAVYQWNVDGGFGYSKTTLTNQLTFTLPSARTVSVRVSNGAGAYTVTSRQVSPGDGPTPNAAPVAHLTRNVSVPKPGQPVTFNASGSSDADGSITSYAWTVDGQPIQGATGATLTRTFTDRSQHAVSVVVTDDQAATGSATSTLTMASNAAPSIQLKASDTAPAAGRPVTITAQAADADGQISAVKLRLPDGSVRDGASHQLTFAAGTVTLTATAYDNEGAPATDTLTLHVTAPPTVTPPPVKPAVTRLALTGPSAKLRLTQLARLTAAGKVTAGRKVTVTLKLSRAQARKAKIKAPAAGLTLARATVTASRNATFSAALKVPAAMRAKLRRARTLTMTVAAQSDAAVARRQVTVRR